LNVKIRKTLLLAPLLAGLSGCKMVLLNPAGYLALQERDLMLFATGLMLLIIVPVIAATLYFAWKYRASNPKADYDPTFHHSSRLELLIWGAPMAIILILGSVTWVTTHTLDPYRSLDRIAAGRPVVTKPIEVDVVALDWKWLFIYPEQGVATVNELALPVDRPVTFKITASSVMNAFSVPAMAGQIYAMPGMQTQLHAVLNKPGVYEGFSSNYSGAGFADMKFRVEGLAPGDFDRWVTAARASDARLTRADYLALERPTQDEPIRRWSAVDADLFEGIVTRCVEAGGTCKAMPPGMGPMASAATRICHGG
jgi:cytochrome o ubiquinol oxidase subunit 2